MTEVLAQFGLGGDDLAAQIDTVTYPKPMQGRVAHIDADFISYQVSAETKDELDGIKERRTVEEMKRNARSAAEHLMRMAGATSYVCHVTPSGSTKGGRPQQAVQQEYQSSRMGRDKPEHLDAIRYFIGSELNGVVHLDQEADDGMAQANYWAEDRNLSVIVSMDKDLRMVPGLHLDFDSDTVVNVNGFGEVWIDESKSSKTLKGWGTAFFWAQCLMGDAADTIKGIPMVPGRTCQEVKPTAKYQSDLKTIAAGKGGKHHLAAQERIDAAHYKGKPCGPVLTWQLIKDIESDKEAFAFIREQWSRLATECGHEYRHWVTQELVTPTQALLGDMQLLWMRRNKNPLDVVDWLKVATA